MAATTLPIPASHNGTGTPADARIRTWFRQWYNTSNWRVRQERYVSEFRLGKNFVHSHDCRAQKRRCRTCQAILDILVQEGYDVAAMMKGIRKELAMERVERRRWEEQEIRRLEEIREREMARKLYSLDHGLIWTEADEELVKERNWETSRDGVHGGKVRFVSKFPKLETPLEQPEEEKLREKCRNQAVLFDDGHDSILFTDPGVQ